MKNYLPKIMAAHDLSGFGKSSLSVVLPILSVMGCYVCCLPTAVLSTITGVFDNFSFADLTNNMSLAINHWEKLNIKFDYIYSGFLGNHKQVDIMLEAKRKFNSVMLVDPVFADHGKVYETMDNDMIDAMRTLVKNADIITPNVTEAQFLLQKDVAPTTMEEYKQYSKQLSKLGPKIVIITSCCIENDMYVCFYQKEFDSFDYVKCKYYDAIFHGTGDIFATVMLGGLANKVGLKQSIEKAVDFLQNCLKLTIDSGMPLCEGVIIEKNLKELI